MPDLLGWSGVGILLLALLLFAISVYVVYSGLLTEIRISTGSSPVKSITVAYKYREGPYRESGLLFAESCRIAPDLPTVGIFYDDPKKVRRINVSSNSCSNTLSLALPSCTQTGGDMVVGSTATSQCHQAQVSVCVKDLGSPGSSHPGCTKLPRGVCGCMAPHNGPVSHPRYILSSEPAFLTWAPDPRCLTRTNE